MISLRYLGLVLLGVVSAGVCSAGSFGDWPKGASPDEVGHRVAENYLARPYQLFGPQRVIHYVETCTWIGSLRFARDAGDRALHERLVRRFDPLLGPARILIPPALNVDYTVFGAVPLELYMETRDQRYLAPGLTLADQQWATPTDESKLSPEAKEGVAAGLSWHTRFWVDDMYMITMLQTQAYRATGEKKYIDRAAAEAVAYLDKLQQPNGLFYHAPDVPFFWGRGNGWFAAGMSELLSALPAENSQRARILVSYQRMMATLLKRQDQSGMWHQLIDDPASWEESSATGMFTFAFITGVKNGWLDEATYGPAARRGWLALVARIDEQGRVRDVCSGLNKANDRQHYFNAVRLVGDLHGQAPIMWCADALMR
ncbi:glycoside hydrolase family 88 protein [Horticoccus luteus]|uniref:Glycoside hydrolase family 88 protein n=1 Tax=Horticoccus luteus TaxID=2862869 RepID=A0A8F9XFX0_9BACT|nr:glycoside hydrolase family 88 protein [Horticoccus luteus]QYM78532.1 glycoside hydrolase family 88 protein [Horticoccus luteus]